MPRTSRGLELRADLVGGVRRGWEGEGKGGGKDGGWEGDGGRYRAWATTML